MYTPILFDCEVIKAEATPYVLFVHVLYFLEYKILWYALRYSWLASK